MHQVHQSDKLDVLWSWGGARRDGHEDSLLTVHPSGQKLDQYPIPLLDCGLAVLGDRPGQGLELAFSATRCCARRMPPALLEFRAIAVHAKDGEARAIFDSISKCTLPSQHQSAVTSISLSRTILVFIRTAGSACRFVRRTSGRRALATVRGFEVSIPAP